MIAMPIILSAQTKESATSNLLENLESKLQRQMAEKIERGEPALPIELTPEEDAELVKEGVLPPAPSCDNQTTGSCDASRYTFLYIGLIAGMAAGYCVGKRNR